eukprot:761579-Hanusia_phi.AAC.1
MGVMWRSCAVRSGVSLTCLAVMPKCITAHHDDELKSISKIMQLLKSLADSVPGIFENGEANCIAPFVAMLFPMLASQQYSKICDDVLETLDSLILLSVSKDIWSVKILLEDSSKLYEKVSGSMGTSEQTSSSPLRCLDNYLGEICYDENTHLDCTIELGDYENRRRVWKVCTSHLCENVNDFSITFLNLLSTLLDVFPVPISESDDILQGLIWGVKTNLLALRNRSTSQIQIEDQIFLRLIECFSKFTIKTASNGVMTTYEEPLLLAIVLMKANLNDAIKEKVLSGIECMLLLWRQRLAECDYQNCGKYFQFDK